jgi:hypothetical protein
MRSILFLLILLALSILSASCTEELKYTKEQLYDLAKSKDPSLTFILPKNMNEGIKCSDYTPGCLSGHVVSVQGLEMIAVEFMLEKDAMVAAKKYRGFYLRNWMFDDVTGEPILENFVVNGLEAKKP